nr:BCCT family transporter [Metabacillus sp. B2-18]
MRNNFTTQITIILIVTVLFMLSVQTVLNKGIKYLSNLNVVSALCLQY